MYLREIKTIQVKIMKASRYSNISVWSECSGDYIITMTKALMRTTGFNESQGFMNHKGLMNHKKRVDRQEDDDSLEERG